MAIMRIPNFAPDVDLPAHYIQALESIRTERITQLSEIPDMPTYGAQYGKLERRTLIYAMYGYDRDGAIAKKIYRTLLDDIGVSPLTIIDWKNKYLLDNGRLSPITIPREERRNMRV